MKEPLYYQDASSLGKLIRNREVSPVEVMAAHLDRIAAVDPDINSIVTVSAGALDAAKKAEAAVMR
jgi:aspartyl-tRNA(Asn)/glutamyl-tRNA(Gln) amidotransferase subunit A